jgi:predicted phage tail component-like protein
MNSQTYLLVNKIKRELMPSVSVPSFKIPKRAGEVGLDAEIASRVFTMDITILGDNSADLQTKKRAISAWLFSENEETLIFSDEPTKEYRVRFNSNADLEQIIDMGQGQISFTAFDPFAYDTYETTKLGAGDSDTYENTGTFKTYPRIRIVPNATVNSIKIFNETNGQTISYNASVPAWSVIIFDCEENRVYMEATGESVMQNIDLSTEFFALEVGSNTIRVEPSAGLAGMTRLYWTNRYL